MIFRAYVGKSYTDHSSYEEAMAVKGATVVAINGGVMVPTSDVEIPDLPTSILVAIRTIIGILLIAMVAVPSYFVYLLWVATH